MPETAGTATNAPATPNATRRKRANGEASRQRILDAAADIAGERGYEGTSINLVSKRSGLPASSIYWHFEDKDQLIAAVIDRSFGQWIEALDALADNPDAEDPDADDPSGQSGPVRPTPDELFHQAMRRTGATIAAFPDFLRLGLMLLLERRPEEPTARRRFLDTRGTTAESTRTVYTAFFRDLGPTDIDRLVTLTMALADGLFIAHEVGEVELPGAFDLLATAILGTATRLRG